MADLETGRTFLQQKVGEQPSIFDHFAQIIDKVILQKPNDPHGALEVLSRLIKAPGPEGERFDEAELAKMKDQAAKTMEITKVPEDESGPKAVCAIPNFMEEAETYEWAGCGFGEMESYQIMCSLRKLGEPTDVIKKLRFWGKILGTNADYYVAEGQLEAEPEVAEGEENDAGLNEYVYWVTTSLTGEWTQLPLIFPKHIKAARSIKKMLTGDLSAKVITHPHFPGVKPGETGDEKLLLRAQIARITADSVLSIKDFIIQGDEGGAIEPNPEWVCPDAPELLKKESWMHERPHIMRSGKTVAPELPEDAEDEEAIAQVEKIKKEIEADPARDRLRGIATDPDLQWAVKQCGDLAMYDAGTGPKSNCITVVRSLTWPGAITVHRGLHSSNIYIGHGLKFGEPDFFPCAPPDIQEEPTDPGEVDDQDQIEQAEEAPAEEEGEVGG